MIKLTELQNGDLEISVTDKDELNELVEKSNNLKFEYGNIDEWALTEMFESARYLGNDWFTGVYVGLTDSPTIAKGLLITKTEETDECYWENNGYNQAWWYPNYMVKSFLDELVETGKTIFDKAW